MLFNYFDFDVFLPVVFLLYWLIFNKNILLRNIFLLVASYVFYGFWDWRFLPLIATSSLTDFFLGRQLGKTDDSRKRKLYLTISLSVNLGILGFFKYYNFFADSFISAFTLFGKPFSYTPLNIILPVGISFYTFQSMSYIIDIYYRKFEPTGKIINFCAFVAFFPQLVAGPIERARELLPQFGTLKKFDYEAVRRGLLQITFGLFKKIVIADRLAVFVDGAYGDISAASAPALLFAAGFFAFQLYFDFSAYSDIAAGTARMLGFRLSANFRRPYLSASFSEFWTRWHITLSSWFRDYVYIPLGGNRRGKRRTVINVLVVFVLSGLWHGASWNFVIWGVINALLMLILDRLFGLEKSGGLKRFVSPAAVFAGWALSLVFFRVPNFSDAVSVFQNMGFGDMATVYQFGLEAVEFKLALCLLAGITIFEITVEKYGERLQQWFYTRNKPVRWSVYLFLIFTIIYMGSYGTSNDNSFIYFQF
jgi:D-alanyl-lipoteichoic acid acyltransferase DltB (MBOAT superfamily)